MRCVARPSLAPCLGGPASSACAAQTSVASAIAASAMTLLVPLPNMSMDDFPLVPPSMADSPVTTRAGRSGAKRPVTKLFNTARVPGCSDVVNRRVHERVKFYDEAPHGWDCLASIEEPME